MANEAVEAALLAHARNMSTAEWERLETARVAANGGEPSNGPVLLRLSTVEPTPVRWLWPGRIPLGKLSILDGDPGLGKSLVTIDLAARVSRGLAMPDGSAGDLSGATGAILLNAEDDPADTVRPRLDAAGGDPERVVLLQGVRRVGEDDKVSVRIPTLADVATIRSAVQEMGAALVVIDPVMAYLGGKDSHVDSQIRELLAPLAALAAELGTAVVLVRHLRKSGGSNALYAGGGSIGIIGAARAGLMVAPDPDDETGERRILAATKCNLSRKPESLLFHVETANEVPHVVWDGTSSRTASDIMEAREGTRSQRPAADEARDFLREVLAHGSRTVSELKDEARRACIAWRSIERAKPEAGVASEKAAFGGGWRWHIPGARVPKAASVGGLGGLRESDPGSTPENRILSESGEERPKTAHMQDLAVFEGRQVVPFANSSENDVFRPPKPKAATKAAKLGNLLEGAASPAPACIYGHLRLWRSKGGVIACGECHPPAAAELVAEWINQAVTTGGDR